MAMIRINAKGERPEMHGRPQPFDIGIRAAEGERGPVIIMIHGFKYQPGNRYRCPHRHLFSMDPDHLPFHAPCWPRQLGFGLGHVDEGIAVAFGWDARGTLVQAQARAVVAGRALAEVIRTLHAQDPQRSIHLIGHSLGAEVAFEALHHVPSAAIHRIVSLTGASYQSRARKALATPAGRGAEFFNITSRENDAFDFLFETLTRRPERRDRAIGQGFEATNAVTLQLDCLDTLERLGQLGHDIAHPNRRVCHWSSYMRPGALRFYKRLMRAPERSALRQMQQSVPEASAARWSRLLSIRPVPRLEPMWQRI